MIVGNPSLFAIESGISSAYERLSLRALGFFVLHVGGNRYGVYAPDSTMLACSFDEVGDRIARRGSHMLFFARDSSPGLIADSISKAVYADLPDEVYFGLPVNEFCDLIYSAHVIWAPDGDEAFDDGSIVLHFDVENAVRLIAFNRLESGTHDPRTLRDAWLPADIFYEILERWQAAFESEWAVLPKQD